MSEVGTRPHRWDARSDWVELWSRAEVMIAEDIEIVRISVRGRTDEFSQMSLSSGGEVLRAAIDIERKCLRMEIDDGIDKKL